MTNIDYELLALNAYDASVINKTPVPGWTTLAWQSDSVLGFSAGAYRNGGDVVIAYAGTNEIRDNEIPLAIYDTNLLIANAPPNDAKFVTFVIKAEEMKDETLGDHYKKLSATFRTPH